MDRLIYTALSGMRRAEGAQALTANNLANASTPGFVKDAAGFDSRWLEPGAEAGAGATRVQAQTGAPALDSAPAAATTTGGALDIALGRDAMLAVAAPGPDGAPAEAYTRRGDLRLAPDRALVTGDGHPVLGAAGPVTLPPADAVQIAADGQILIRAPGAAAGDLTPVDRLRLVKFDAARMTRGADGAIRTNDGAPLAADASLTLTPGAVTGSNADPVGALVELVGQSRAFQLSTRLVTTARDLDQSGAELMRLSS